MYIWKGEITDSYPHTMSWDREIKMMRLSVDILATYINNKTIIFWQQ